MEAAPENRMLDNDDVYRQYLLHKHQPEILTDAGCSCATFKHAIPVFARNQVIQLDEISRRPDHSVARRGFTVLSIGKCSGSVGY